MFLLFRFPTSFVQNYARQKCKNANNESRHSAVNNSVLSHSRELQQLFVPAFRARRCA